MIRKVLAVLFAAFAATSNAFPQTPPQEQEEPLRVTTAVVQLDVIVTDKSGRRVTGLTAADFQVTDEGQPQPVDYFTAIDGSRVVAQKDARPAAGTPGAPGAHADAAGLSPLTRPYPARHIALIVDDQNLSHENLLRVRRALSEYVGKLSPNDMAALVSTGGRLGLLQQFTNDKQRLLAAINRVAATGEIRSGLLSQRFKMTVPEAQRVDMNDQPVIDAIVARVALEETGTDMMVRQQLEEQIRVEARAHLSQVGLATQITLKTLDNLFRAMADIPGRKTAVLLAETLVTLGGTSASTSDQMNQLIERARRSGVSVYALDAGGVRTGNVPASQHMTGNTMRVRELMGSISTFTDFERLDAARALAIGTGGSLIPSTNDIAAGIDRAIEDASSYYVVGFRPAALDNKFHRVAITIKGKPDLVVRTRRGYLAVNQETVQGTNTELAAALISPVPRIDLPVEVVANAVPQGGAQTVLVGFHVGRNYLQLPAPTAADQTATYDVLAYIFAAGKDQPVGGVKRTLTFDLSKPEERQKLKTAGLVFVPAAFTLEPGQHQIRVVVREKTSGAVGSSYQFFEVPDVQNKKVVSASSVLMSAAGQSGFSGANSFKPGAEVDVRFVVYNPPKDVSELTQQVRLIDSQGRALLDSPLAMVAAPADNPAMAVQATRFKLPPARGRYALIVKLRDRKGKVDIERRADFVIE